MKLGDGVEAAIHCATALAALEDGAVMPGAALAEFHGLSPSYLVKHLNAMVGAGLVHSIPGRNGGYRLAKTPDAITLLDIVLAVEGPGFAFQCREIRKRGPDPLPEEVFSSPCGIKLAMLRAERAYRAALAETTLASIIKDHVSTADPRVMQRGCAFLDLHQRPQST